MKCRETQSTETPEPLPVKELLGYESMEKRAIYKEPSE
jgi:hypothetical protein